MTEAIVLDSSAMLALVRNEPGGSVVAQAIAEERNELYVSSVNLCEVASKLAYGGGTGRQIMAGIEPFLSYAVDFDAEQAVYAAELSRWTKPLGLSLGDRACLALAAKRGATAWTTDTAWRKLSSNVLSYGSFKIHLLRG